MSVPGVYNAQQGLDSARDHDQHAGIDPLDETEVILSTEAKLLRIIRQMQQDAAAYLPGEIAKDEFIDRVLRSIDGPEWREVETALRPRRPTG